MLTESIVGIDLGSQLAGTTVLATGVPVRFYPSVKKKNADTFILETLKNLPVSTVYLDAPLSLPGVYRPLPGFTDYFYRQGDRELQAMSPMFLGGLTARAIRLKDTLEAQGIKVYEAYPAPLAKLWGLPELGYKKQKSHIQEISNKLRNDLPFPIPDAKDLLDWHHVDALLALAIGYRHQTGQAQSYGNELEGMIWV